MQPALPSIPQGQRNFLLRLLLGVLVTLFVLGGLWLLFSVRTTDAIRSPWDLIPPHFFAFLFLANVAALQLLWLPAPASARRDWLVLTGLTGIPVLTGIVIYAVGYGFDPFVHQATETVIYEQGAILPKPFYYLGQYGLIVSLAALLQQSVRLIDTILLPLVATLVLPLLALSLGRIEEPEERRTTTLTAAALLALPLSSFIVTTPQGIANLLLLAVIFLSFANDRRPRPRQEWMLLLLALSALLIHPIAGLPAILLLAFRYCWRRFKRPSLMAGGALLTLPVLPLLFLYQERLRDVAVTAAALPTIAPEKIHDGFFYLTQQFQLVLDAVYLYGFNLPIFVTGLAVIGVGIAWRQGYLRAHLGHLILAAVLVVDSYLITQFIPFRYLIDYERGNFVARLLTVVFFLLLPFATIPLRSFFRRIGKTGGLVALFFLLLLALVRTAGTYLTYPRFDGYQFDRGYSTSAYDLEAVQRIDERATAPYVVLANQAVSAAALRELGFQTYYERHDQPAAEPIFFYPIPTGGPLYQNYLQMVYESPTRQPIMDALTMTGAEEAYFVLNDYWFNAVAIAEEAKLYADEWWEIADGKVLIFRYIK